MTIPKMQPVESSNIAAVGYSPDDKAMYLQFKSGGMYRYDSVPAAAHDEFLKAESKGRHFSQNFAGRFQHTKIDPNAH